MSLLSVFYTIRLDRYFHENREQVVITETNFGSVIAIQANVPGMGTMTRSVCRDDEHPGLLGLGKATASL